MKTRIMYIELKAGGLTGPARIGRVTFSKSGATVCYQGKAFQSLRGSGFKSNYFDVETGDHYWIVVMRLSMTCRSKRALALEEAPACKQSKPSMGGRMGSVQEGGPTYARR